MRHADCVTAVLGGDMTLRPMEGLMREIERYLDVVAAFRALGHEPDWKSEETP